MRVTAIIAAAGMGHRVDTERPKQFLNLKGRPLLAWSLAALGACPFVDELIVVAPPSEQGVTTGIVDEWAPPVRVKVVPGGARRQDSVRLGLAAVDTSKEWVAVHDAARPLVTPQEVEEVCLMAYEIGAAILASPIFDTVKKVDEDGFIVRTLDRDRLYLAQTPQVCRRADLEAAFNQAEALGKEVADEASLLEAMGQAVGVVSGSRRNLKVTTAEDLRLAEALIDQG